MADNPANPAHTANPETADGRRSRKGRLSVLPVWWPLPACAVLGLAAGGAYGVLKTPQYAATSYVVAVPDDDTEPATAQGFAQAYARIATSQSTLAYAQPRAGVSAKKLRAQVRAETSPESPMIAITGTDGDPAKAADIANAVADALSLSSNQAAKNTGVQLLMFNQAVAPPESISPSAPISAAVGMCAGGLLGGLALLAGPGARGRRREDGEGAEGLAGVPAGYAPVYAPVAGVGFGPVAALPAQAEGGAAAKEKESAR
ncbi:YveK family protein [Streptomyces sp. BI20]|uniref:YveK family protein n=1 Tax=Streptomyces sp. BI20 TaxID=3403460 RepID=UPI003C70E7BB